MLTHHSVAPASNIPLLAEEWRDSHKAGAPGWSVRRSVSAGLPLRLRPIGLALRSGAASLEPSPCRARAASLEASPCRARAASLEASPCRARASRPPLRGGEFTAAVRIR